MTRTLAAQAPIALSFLTTLGVAVGAPRLAHADLRACIAASEQSLSLRRAGKLRDARQQLVACTAPTCPDELKAECAKRMEAVNAAMPSLVLRAKDGAGNDLLAGTVTVDGVEVPSALGGRPIEIDPGEHVVRVTVPGEEPVERKVVLGEGEKTRRENFVVGKVAVVVAPPPPPPVEAAPSGLGGRRTLAIVAGSVGVVGVGVGATFGLLASSDWSTAKNAVTSQASCTSASICPAHATAVSNHDNATTFATVSTVGFGVGGALIVAGVVTWLTAPWRARESGTALPLVMPTVTAQGGGLSLQGRF